MARKPSHFGSYCHPSPVGMSATVFASMGASGGSNGRSIPACYPGRRGDLLAPHILAPPGGERNPGLISPSTNDRTTVRAHGDE